MLGAAIAGAAIATSLIEALIAKRILSEAEARVSVGDGQNRVFQVTDFHPIIWQPALPLEIPAQYVEVESGKGAAALDSRSKRDCTSGPPRRRRGASAKANLPATARIANPGDAGQTPRLNSSVRRTLPIRPTLSWRK